MSNTPNKPEGKPEGSDKLESLGEKGHGHVERRHAEMLGVQEQIVQATKSISRATWLYGIMAGLTLFWLIAMFFINAIYF